ncbi:hypothetical protein WJ61_21815 [Burkholderia ubonensis]|nr:hypothetical protein WJ61_21815 [Burkholderia ubonensis]OJA87138.1 hypothetical protein BGV49_11135 [Burkholderia ubonensis]
MFSFLARHGVELARPEGAGSRAVERAAEMFVPDWFKPFVGRNQVSLRWAAAILAGVDLDASGFISDDEGAEISKWQDALIDAVEHHEIAAGTWGADRGEQMLAHGDIRAWCASRGHTWPIPDPNPLPATDAALIERWQSAETKVVALTRQLDEALAVADDCTKLRRQVADLAGKEATLKAEVEAANAKIRELSGDIAQGKTLTVMRRVIAGLWRVNYVKGDAQPARLEGLGAALNDLQSVGVSVGEDALRGYIKGGLEDSR